MMDFDYPDLDDNYMGKIGNFTGLIDMNGSPIHLGDTLEFDADEWGGEHIFQLLFEDGELNIGFEVEALSEWCFIVKKWND